MTASIIEVARLDAAYGQIAATLFIGLLQVGVVWFGIRVMQRQGRERSREQDQRHEESMTALKALIERTGARS